MENYILKIQLHKFSLILKISLTFTCNLKVLFHLYITGEYIKLLSNNGTKKQVNVHLKLLNPLKLLNEYKPFEVNSNEALDNSCPTQAVIHEY